jgi:hypothetical protein
MRLLHETDAINSGALVSALRSLGFQPSSECRVRCGTLLLAQGEPLLTSKHLKMTGKATAASPAASKPYLQSTRLQADGRAN